MRFLTLFLICYGCGWLLAADEAPKPPIAKMKAKQTELHGDKLVDNYFWLREKSNPEVVQSPKLSKSGSYSGYPLHSSPTTELLVQVIDSLRVIRFPESAE